MEPADEYKVHGDDSETVRGFCENVPAYPKGLQLLNVHSWEQPQCSTQKSIIKDSTQETLAWVDASLDELS